MNRRGFLSGAIAGAATAGAATLEPHDPKEAAVRKSRLKAGHQHHSSDADLRVSAALGVHHICSELPSRNFDDNWSVAGLSRLRERVEKFGIKLDMVPLPLGDMPTAPVVEYLARTVSAFYALVGTLCLVMAADLERYRPLVRFLALALVVMKVVFVAVDVAAGMPWWWSAWEGPPGIGVGIGMYYLARPTLLVSPWVEQAIINSEFDHTSLLKYLTEKWSLGSLTERVAHIRTTGEARTDTPGSVPIPQFDFVSRAFFLRLGVDEDPVCGSAPCCLADFWRERLGKSEFVAFQVSARGGVVKVRVVKDRGFLSGKATTVAKGEVLIEGGVS